MTVDYWMADGSTKKAQRCCFCGCSRTAGFQNRSTRYVLCAHCLAHIIEASAASMALLDEMERVATARSGQRDAESPPAHK